MSSLPRSRSYDLDSRDNSSTVFEPVSIHISTKGGMQATTPPPPGSDEMGGAEGVVTVEDPEFPRLGVDQPVINELPSRREGERNSQRENGNTITSASNNNGSSTSAVGAPSIVANGDGSGSDPAGHLVSISLSPPSKKSTGGGSGSNSSKPKRSKPKGPAGFPSAEDLMHRLFLGISGVADQLQSNHAKEVRVILKHVFAVCQSEPDSPTATFCGPAGVGHGVYEVNSLEPCTPEPQSPLITDSQSN